MKKRILLGLILVSVSIVGCNKNTETDTKKAPVLSQDTQPIIPESVDIDTISFEDKDGDVVLIQSVADQIILPERYAEKHKKLAEVINLYNLDAEALANSFIDQNKEDIRTMRRERNDDTLVLSYSSTVQIVRIDDVVFSFMENRESYTGGAHGSYMPIARSFDAKDGRELVIDDVISDKNKFKTVLVDKIEKAYGQELFDEWKDTINTHFEEKRPFNILVRNDYFDVTFDPYYLGPWSTGSINVSIGKEDGVLDTKYFN